MKTEFIIVIEADNRRAHAAYLKGLADLDLIWPQLMAYAASIDDPINELINKESDEWTQIQRNKMEEFNSYDEAMAIWRKSKKILRGPAPSVPSPASRHYSHGYAFEHKDRMRSAYESMRAELKRMADLAGAALGPFRMSEDKVAEMISWEDGSKIEYIKQRIQKHEQTEGKS